MPTFQGFDQGRIHCIKATSTIVFCRDKLAGALFLNYRAPGGAADKGVEPASQRHHSAPFLPLHRDRPHPKTARPLGAAIAPSQVLHHLSKSRCREH